MGGAPNTCDTGSVTTPTTPQSDTGTVTEERVDYRYQEGDDERFAHYVLKVPLLQSAVEGTPVQALCGKVWVPTRDAKRFPICPECVELYKLTKVTD